MNNLLKMIANNYILNFRQKLLACFILGFVLLGCSKHVEKPTKDPKDPNPSKEETEISKNVKYKVIIDASFALGNTGTNNVSSSNNPIVFEWNATSEQDPEMLTLVYGNDAFVKWTADSKECYCRAIVTPNQDDKTRATLTTLSKTEEEIKVGSLVYNLSPIKKNNSQVYTQSLGLLAELDMPNNFINDSKQGLSIFKDYTYIYATTAVASVRDSSSGEGIIKCNNAKFKALSSVIKMNVINNLSGNKDIDVRKITMTALKNNVEQRLFPNKMNFLIRKDNAYTEDYQNKDTYYSTLSATMNNKEVISMNKSESFYMLFFPINIKDAFNDVIFKFDITTKIGDKEKIYTVISTLDNISNNNFESGYVYTFDLEVKDPDITDKTHYDDGEVVLAYEGSYPDGFKIIITGDGYTKKDLEVGGKMDSDMNEAINTIFSVEPYKSYKNYFKIYKLFAQSNESGASGYSIDNDKTTILNRDTKFKISYESPSSSGLDCGDFSTLLKMAAAVPGFSYDESPNTSAILMLVNNSKYGGSCYMLNHGFSLAMCPMNMEENSSKFRVCVNYRNLILHEFCGHGVGRLGDEYILHSDESINSDSGKYAWITSDQNSGMSLNLSLVGDATQVAWKDFIGHPSYERVNVFEGGFYYGKDVWRCENISCMDNNIPYFNAYSRYLQYKRIKETVKESCTLAEFMAQDKAATMEVPVIAKTKMTNCGKEYPRLAPPKVMDYKELLKYISDKK